MARRTANLLTKKNERGEEEEEKKTIDNTKRMFSGLYVVFSVQPQYHQRVRKEGFCFSQRTTTNKRQEEKKRGKKKKSVCYNMYNEYDDKHRR